MVYNRSKYFITTKPLYFPEKRFVVISYDNIVEVHDQDHEVVWTVREQSNVEWLERQEKHNNQFYVAVSNGDIKCYDLRKFETNCVMMLNVPIKKIFLHEKGIIVIEKDLINLYPEFNLGKKTLILNNIALAKVAFSAKTEIIACVQDKEILIKNLAGKLMKHNIKQIKDYFLTCVACHPIDNTIATGDSSGQIIIWSNVLSGFYQTTIYHWHFLSLNSIAFDYDGTHLLSGGKEGVFVKWEVAIKDSDLSRRFYPRLESHIESITSYNEIDGEYYLLTLSDNSYRILTSLMGCINTYYNFMQRSSNLHNKIVHKSKLCPVGLISCHNMPGDLQYSVMTNGHEGSLQFFNLLKNRVDYQLDVTRQNWPTENENNLIPGFIQVRKVAVSKCGHYIATFEKSGINSKNVDSMSTLKLFHWKSDNEKFILQTIIPFDLVEDLTDIIFHPSKSDYVIVISKTKRFFIISRNTLGEHISWKIVHSVVMPEVLYQFHENGAHQKIRQNAILSSVKCSHNESDGLLVIGYQGFITIYLWSHLIQFKTVPLMAKIDNKCDIIMTSLDIFINQTDIYKYRIVCGLFTGFALFEINLKKDGTVQLESIIQDFCEMKGKCTVSRSPKSSNEAVALFEENSTVVIFDVWQNTKIESFTNKLNFYNFCWVKVKDENNDDKWVIAGIRVKSHRVFLFTCEDTPEITNVKKNLKESKSTGLDLLANIAEEEGVIMTQRKKVSMKKADDEQIKKIIKYDTLDMTRALESLYSL